MPVKRIRKVENERNEERCADADEGYRLCVSQQAAGASELLEVSRKSREHG
jgi:hypothetical protein